MRNVLLSPIYITVFRGFPTSLRQFKCVLIAHHILCFLGTHPKSTPQISEEMQSTQKLCYNAAVQYKKFKKTHDVLSSFLSYLHIKNSPFSTTLPYSLSKALALLQARFFLLLLSSSSLDECLVCLHLHTISNKIHC
jgi:hypothetical protein